MQCICINNIILCIIQIVYKEDSTFAFGDFGLNFGYCQITSNPPVTLCLRRPLDQHAEFERKIFGKGAQKERERERKVKICEER